MKKIGRDDAALAAAVAVAAFGVYLRTLLPDVGGPEDSPKFQYLGAALGTAHPPGYPLHTLLSHGFSYLPLGTIAYRANLLSAAAGAAAVAMAALLARASGASRPAAAFAALTMAFGSAFWHYSVLAEVYTLSAALLLAIVFWLVRWKETRRDAHLYLAAFCFALALGNHLAIVATAPAIALFLLVTDRKRALRFSTLTIAGAIVLSGFVQYTYILIRTRQGAGYREAAATTFGQLLNVIRASDYKEYVFAFGWHEFLAYRVPEFHRLVREELGVVGLAATLGGLLALFVWRWRVAALVTAGFAGIAVLVVNMQGDLRGFLVIPLVLAVPCLAAGADLVYRPFARLGRVGAVLAAVLVLAYPAWRLRANFALNDWRSRTHDARFFRAWFGQLPPDAAVLSEGYVADSIMAYLEVETGRRLKTVPPFPGPVRTLFEAGTPVYALDTRYVELAPRGFDFEPVEIPYQPHDPDDPVAPVRHRGYRLAGLLPTIPFGDATWHDVTAAANNGLVTVLVDNYHPHDAVVILYAVADIPLRPVLLEDRVGGTGIPTMEVRQFDRGGSGSSLELNGVVAGDQGAGTLLGAAGRYVARIEHRVNDDGQFATWGVSFGAIPVRVVALARPDRPSVARALISEVHAGRLLARGPWHDIGLGFRSEPLVGAGWHLPERDAEGEFRWTSSRDAHFLMPLEIVEKVSISIRVMGRASTSVTLVVNGRELTPCTLDGSWQTCTWRLPPGVGRPGTNQVTLRTPVVARPSDERQAEDSRILGIAVRSIRVGP